MAVVVKDRVWPHLRYEPHDGQQRVHNSPARHRVASCGRRWGKSTVGGRELVPEAVYTFSLLSALREIGKKRRFWIVGPDYSDTEKEFRVLFDDLKRLEMPFDKPGTYNNPLQGDMHISMWDGAFQVHGKSARHPDSLDGEGLFGVELVEAAKMKPFIWGKFLRPALADELGWSLHTSTPEGKNQFYELWQNGQDPNNPDWESWRMPSWENDVVFPGGIDDPEIQAMRRDMSAERFNQEIGADFTEFVGRVFKEFDEELHVRDLEYNPSWPLYGACDYGWTNPFVWLAIQMDVWDNVYVLGEYRRENRDINDIARDLDSWPLAKNASVFYPDPAQPGETAVLEKHLKIRANKSTGGQLKWRLELIRQYLRMVPDNVEPAKQYPKLVIDRSCHGLIREMLEYRYPDTKEESTKARPEEPLDKDDHGPEALGRFFRGHFGPPGSDEDRGHARVRKALVTSHG